MMTREQVVSRVRALKAFGLKVKRRPIPRQMMPRTLEMEYGKALVPFLENAWRLVEQEVLPLAKRELARFDEDWNTLLDALNARFFTSLSVRALEDAARRFAGRTSQWNRDQLRRQVVAGLGVELPLNDTRLGPLIDAFLQENVALVKSIPNRFLDDVERQVTVAVRQGLRYEVLAAQLKDRFGVAQREAEKIARDQVGKFYADVNQVRQEDLGVTAYVWRTMNDNRTRPEHQRREGQRFTWKSPPPGGHPGRAVLCRCYAEPDLSAFLGAA